MAENITQEQRNRLGDLTRGVKLSEERREAIRRTIQGHKISLETRALISAHNGRAVAHVLSRIDEPQTVREFTSLAEIARFCGCTRSKARYAVKTNQLIFHVFQVRKK